jgi:outer membrane protein assembly factor BamA
VLLAPARLVFEVATEPIYQLVRLDTKYRLREHLVDLFFNDARTFGVFPTVFVETGIGLNAGLRLVHRNLFGGKENLLVRAGFSTVHRQLYRGRLAVPIGAGARLRIEGGYERRGLDRFYGVGNADEVKPGEVSPPVDPFDGPAVRTFFRTAEAYGGLAAEQKLTRTFRVRLAHRWRWRKWTTGQPREDDENPWTDQIFDPSRLPILGASRTGVYTELRLRWSNWSSRVLDASAILPTRGWRIDVWGGWHVEDWESFGRVGVDVQPHVHLFGGDRVLRFRLRLESVLGPHDRIPFVDLPDLGGDLLLRGYRAERFRGRIAALGSVEYRYPVQPTVSGYLFVDAGRVYDGPNEVTHEGMRVGFGGGVLLFDRSTFLVRLQIASSIDGELFVRAGVEPNHALGATY